MHDYVHNYNSSFKDVCAKGVDAWLEAHRPEVAALIDKAAEQTMSDETVYSEVAKWPSANSSASCPTWQARL